MEHPGGYFVRTHMSRDILVTEQGSLAQSERISISKERNMTGSSKRFKSKSMSSARLARPAHKKAGGAHRKAVKHVAKASRSGGGSEQYMKYSGKFTVRLPKSLHQALVVRAEKEGVSLNLFVTNALSSKVAVPSKRK